MSDPVYVYNPDDEDDKDQYNGHIFILKANQATLIESPFKDISAEVIADHIVERQGRWGLCRVSGPVVNGKAEKAADQEIVDKAEVTYTKATKAWCDDVIVDDAKSRKCFTDAGVSGPLPSVDVRRAQAWLKQNADKVKALELIVG